MNVPHAWVPIPSVQGARNSFIAFFAARTNPFMTSAFFVLIRPPFADPGQRDSGTAVWTFHRLEGSNAQLSSGLYFVCAGDVLNALGD